MILNIISRNIIRFSLLVLLQVLILNRMELFGVATPYMYILFIILLPFETPNAVLLIFAFLLGFFVDIFSDSLGVHASASVFIAFIRPFILNRISPRDGYGVGTFPRLYYYGFSWFFKYALILIVAHHVFYFFMEAFSFEYFFVTLKKIIYCSVFSLSLIILSQFFMYKK